MNEWFMNLGHLFHSFFMEPFDMNFENSLSKSLPYKILKIILNNY